MMRDRERTRRHAGAAVGRDGVSGRGQRTGWTTGWRPYWRDALAVVIGVTMMALAACDIDTGMSRAEADGASSASGERAAPAVRPASGGSGAAMLVANRRPVPVPETPPPPVNVTYEDAEGVFRTGDYGEAAELFEAYTLRKPENPWGHYMLGLSAWRADDLARAEAALRKTVELDPDHGKGLLNLARVLLEQEKASDALGYVEQVVELDPESADGWRVLGNVRSELGSVEEAVEAYRKALVLDPEDAWSMNNLALLMIREGRYEEALSPLARATALRPEVAVFQNNLGIALERTGHLGDAVDAFRAALDADADYEKARISLERVEERIPTATPAPLDLPALASAFADAVNQWQVQRLEAESAEPMDTVGMEPTDTVGVEPEGAAAGQPTDTVGAEQKAVKPVQPTDPVGPESIGTVRPRTKDTVGAGPTAAPGTAQEATAVTDRSH